MMAKVEHEVMQYLKSRIPELDDNATIKISDNCVWITLPDGSTYLLLAERMADALRDHEKMHI